MKRTKQSFITLTLFLLILTSFTPNLEAVTRGSVTGPMIEIGNASAGSNEVEVPIRLHNQTRLASGSFVVEPPAGSSAFDLVGFEIMPKFDGSQFHTTARVIGNRLHVDFMFTDTNGNARIDSDTIGYIIYDVSKYASEGEQATIALKNVSIMDSTGREQRTESFNGTVTKQRPVGDVLGTNEINAAQAMRILQHVQGNNPIVGSESKRLADVDGNGNIDQMDAKKILMKVTGQIDSFISIKTEQLPNILLEEEYSVKLEAENGGAPYKWSSARGSRLPAGIRLDSETGILSGTTRLEGDHSFTIEVTDRNANVASKTFNVKATKSNIEEIESLEPVSVEVGGNLNLPSTVQVYYKNGSTVTLPVSWNSLNTNIEGEFQVMGMVGDTGEQASIKVIVYNESTSDAPVIPEKQIKMITDRILAGIGQVTIHTLQVETTELVYSMEVQAQVKDSRGRTTTLQIPMHYEGDSNFSLATPRFSSGTQITLVAYGEFGKKITEKTYRLK